MRGPKNLDDVVNEIVREAKHAEVRAPASTTPGLLRKLAAALREAPDPTKDVSYTDLYTVKRAAYGR